MKIYFRAAAMSSALKLTSGFGIVLLAAVSYQAHLTRPPPEAGQFTYYFGIIILALLPGLLIGSLLFMVRGYSVSQTHLYIHRLLWKTAIPLNQLTSVEFTPDKLKGSIRRWGNAGLLAFTGVYQNKTLGRYRLFATNFSHAVILYSPTRTVVITPAQPERFINYMTNRLSGFANNDCSFQAKSPEQH